MIPVEEGRISFGSHPANSPASAHMRRASFSPCRPVQALAFPALTTTPRSFPAAMFSRPIFTGAAKTLFVVNTAAATAGTSQTSSPTSGVFFVLMPAWTAPALKPAGDNRWSSAMAG